MPTGKSGNFFHAFDPALVSQGVTERQRGVVAHLGHQTGAGDTWRIRMKTTKEDRDFVWSTIYCSPERVANGRQPFVLEQKGRVRSLADSVNNSGFGAGNAST
jgi:hypothetical protein